LEVQVCKMNKLTITNNSNNSCRVKIDVNGIDISQIANHAELVFEPCCLPVLKVDIPLWDVQVELLDSIVEPIIPEKFCEPIYSGDTDGKIETKTD